MMWLTILWNNRITRTIGAILLAVLGVLTFGQVKKREGRKEAEADAKDFDYEMADDIRDNVRNNLDDELRKHDDAGWRDDE